MRYFLYDSDTDESAQTFVTAHTTISRQTDDDDDHNNNYTTVPGIDARTSSEQPATDEAIAPMALAAISLDGSPDYVSQRDNIDNNNNNNNSTNTDNCTAADTAALSDASAPFDPIPLADPPTLEDDTLIDPIFPVEILLPQSDTNSDFPFADPHTHDAATLAAEQLSSQTNAIRTLARSLGSTLRATAPPFDPDSFLHSLPHPLASTPFVSLPPDPTTTVSLPSSSPAHTVTPATTITTLSLSSLTRSEDPPIRTLLSPPLPDPPTIASSTVVAGPHVRIVTNLPATPNASRPTTPTAQQTALRGLHEELLQQAHRHLLDHYEENETMLDINTTPDTPMEDIIMEEAIPPLPPIRPLRDPPAGPLQYTAHSHSRLRVPDGTEP
jgi:hypothetical protein